jgi:hypothetical protein
MMSVLSLDFDPGFFQPASCLFKVFNMKLDELFLFSRQGQPQYRR